MNTVLINKLQQKIDDKGLWLDATDLITEHQAGKASWHRISQKQYEHYFEVLPLKNQVIHGFMSGVVMYHHDLTIPVHVICWRFSDGFFMSLAAEQEWSHVLKYDRFDKSDIYTCLLYTSPSPRD